MLARGLPISSYYDKIMYSSFIDMHITFIRYQQIAFVSGNVLFLVVFQPSKFMMLCSVVERMLEEVLSATLLNSNRKCEVHMDINISIVNMKYKFNSFLHFSVYILSVLRSSSEVKKKL